MCVYTYIYELNPLLLMEALMVEGSAFSIMATHLRLRPFAREILRNEELTGRKSFVMFTVHPISSALIQVLTTSQGDVIALATSSSTKATTSSWWH